MIIPFLLFALLLPIHQSSFSSSHWSPLFSSFTSFASSTSFLFPRSPSPLFPRMLPLISAPFLLACGILPSYAISFPTTFVSRFFLPSPRSTSSHPPSHRLFPPLSYAHSKRFENYPLILFPSRSARAPNSPLTTLNYPISLFLSSLLQTTPSRLFTHTTKSHTSLGFYSITHSFSPCTSFSFVYITYCTVHQSSQQLTSVSISFFFFLGSSLHPYPASILSGVHTPLSKPATLPHSLGVKSKSPLESTYCVQKPYLAHL